MKNLDKCLKELKLLLPELELRREEPMKNHCSFRIGGPVTAMAFPKSREEAETLAQTLAGADIEPFVMGNGTNLLISDRPLDMFVIKTCDGLGAIEDLGGGRIFAESGATLARIAVFAKEHGLAGLEFAHGIPGSLGGAVSMNAGAYGGEMKDVVESTVFLDSDMELFEISGAEHEFKYRGSVFSDTDTVLLGSTLRLSPGDPAAIGVKMKELMEKRRSSQPLDMPSAGSTFKRPVGGYAAALIDEAGLKGFGIGGARVSDKHAGFVVNVGGATFDEVIALMEHIRETVYKRSGIELEPEVKIIDM